MPDWQDLKTFLALGRHGSLSAAARALAVTHATVARRMQSLEAALGEKLVERRPEGYVLTAAGIQAMDAASDMEIAAQTLGRDGSDGSPRGLVRVNASPALAEAFLIRKLAEIVGRYSGLDIDLATDLRPVSLDRHEADIAIRLGRPQDGDLIARRLVSIGYGFYGTPEVCARVAGGERAVFIGFDEAHMQVPEAAWLNRHFPNARVAFRANNQFAQSFAAQSGVGLALLPHYIGRTDVLLRPCPLDSAPPPREAWLLTRPQYRKDVAIRTVAERIIEVFAAERMLFE